MDADHSIELGPTAPALEFPWQDPHGRLHFIDLRSGPGSTESNVAHNVERIPEAQLFPSLLRFLIALNSPPSAWQSAKCDVWSGETESAENLYDAGFTQSCYVDIVFAEQFATLRESLEVHQRMAKEMVQSLEMNEALEASCEIVVRRCYFHRGLEASAMAESVAGYCLTLFITGYGSSPSESALRWEHAMESSAECLLELQPR
jgi:hypothetical protein